MADVKRITRDVLTNATLMSLATYDDGGVWVADVEFMADAHFNIYWSSLKAVRHSVAIEKNPHVAGSIHLTLLDRSKNLGLQFSGQAARVEPGEMPPSEEYFTKYGYKSQEKILSFFEPTKSWYKLTFDKLELNFPSETGYQKEPVKIS